MKTFKHTVPELPLTKVEKEKDNSKSGHLFGSVAYPAFLMILMVVLHFSEQNPKINGLELSFYLLLGSLFIFNALRKLKSKEKPIGIVNDETTRDSH